MSHLHLTANRRAAHEPSRSRVRPGPVFSSSSACRRGGVRCTRHSPDARADRQKQRERGMDVRLKSGFSNWDCRAQMQRYLTGKRRYCPFKGEEDLHQGSYKRFRRRIIQRSTSHGPAASTPLTTWGQHAPRCEFDTVCQRLQLDSTETHQDLDQENYQETVILGGSSLSSANTPRIEPSSGRPPTEKPGWVWRSADSETGNTQQAAGHRHMQPFAVLEKSPLSSEAVMKLAAPSLLNDYYSNLLDCSCIGMIALALGSSVYLWNSETQTLVGHLEPSERGRPAYDWTVSCLCWSRDGRVLCIGTRRGEIQLWDVEKNGRTRCLPSHLSVVRALSWKQQLLSSGSVLGRIHHFDPRAPVPLVGAAVQDAGICSLQWSPEEDLLASGSADGLLCVWDGDVAGLKRACQPIMTMKQPSALKAMGWCPWQRKVIATGGGWKDGELRIWDTDSAACLTSADTNSQICSLQWTEKERNLVTGHGLPHHQITCWSWSHTSLSPSLQLTGHSQRVLHLAVNPDSTQIFSAGADQRFHIWDI